MEKGSDFCDAVFLQGAEMIRTIQDRGQFSTGACPELEAKGLKDELGDAGLIIGIHTADEVGSEHSPGSVEKPAAVFEKFGQPAIEQNALLDGLFFVIQPGRRHSIGDALDAKELGLDFELQCLGGYGMGV